MANYLYTELPEFSVLSFNPYADSLDFTGSAVTSFAQLVIGGDDNDNGDDHEVDFLTDERFIFLQIDDPQRFTEANFIFSGPNASRILIGDNSNGVKDDDLANTLIGGAGDDMLAGLGGNDSVSGGAGNDFIMMFSGDNDQVGADTIDGGSGFDLIDMRDLQSMGRPQTVNANLATGSIAMTGVTGFDSMGDPSSFSTQTASIVGGSIEALLGAEGNDTLVGNASANYLNGADGNDTIDGGSGNDSLFGGFGNDTLQGGLGDDLIRGGPNPDRMMGGDGSDTFWYFSSTGDTLDGGLGTDTAVTPRSASIQNAANVENLTLDGTAGPDSTEETFALFFSGNYDGDTNPFFNLVPELVGNSLANVLTGNDRFNFFLGGPGNDTFAGNGGLDVVEYDGPPEVDPLLPTGGLSVLFTGGGGGSASASGTGTDSFSGIEGVVGSQFADLINGGSGNDDQILVGGARNDTISGGGGNDTIFGNQGNDNIDGGLGSRDVAGYFDAKTGIVASLATQIVSNDGEDFDSDSGNGIQLGADALSGIEDLAGGTFNDSITGSSVENRLWGGAGDDTLIGGSGNDMLDGGLGRLDQVRYDDVVLGAVDGIHVNLGLGLARDASQLANVLDTLPDDTVVNIEPTLDAILLGKGHLDTLANVEWIVGPQYDDTLIGGNPNHEVKGLAFTDSLEIFEGRRGNDSIDGGDHNEAGSDNGYSDIVSYLGDVGGVGVTVNLGTGTATDSFNDVDTLVRIDGVWGSAWADSLTGGSASLNFYGDQFEFFLGGGGNDSIDGSTGLDRADYNIGAQQGVTATLIDGAAGTWTVLDGTDQDTVTGGIQQGTDSLSGIEGIRGSQFADQFFTTGSGNDHFFEGMGGADTIVGWNGSDTTLYVRSPNGVVVNLSETSVGTSFGSLGANSAFDGFDSNSGTDGLQPFTDSLTNIENAFGSDYSDTFIGQPGENNSFDGRGGVRQDGLLPFTHRDTVDYSQGGHTNSGITVNLGAGPLGAGTATYTHNDTLVYTDTLVNIEFVIGTSQNDTITGSNTAAEYTGTFTDRSESFRGGGGNDSFDGGSSSWGNNDTLDYGNSTLQVIVDLSTGIAFNDGFGGADTFTNIDAVFGGSGNDFLTGGSDSRGYSGVQFETFRGGAGNDFIDGRDGFDTADYSNAATSVFVQLDFESSFSSGFGGGTASDGLGGIDQLFNIEQVRGGQFNDNLTGGGNGSGDREVFQGNAGDDFIDGQDGLDLASYVSSPNAVYVDTGRGFALDGWGGSDNLLNIEGAQGSDFNDTLIGGVNSNNGEADWQVFEGRAGDDLIDGADGFDSGIPGVVDNDLDAAEYRNAPSAVNVDLVTGVALDGYGTTDALVGIEIVVGSRWNDTIIGGNASSVAMRFEGYNGRAGDDSMVGGDGDDWLLYEEDQQGVTVNLATGTATDGWDSDFNDANGVQAGTDTFTSMEHVIGSEYDDTIVGSSADNFLHGADGGDIFVGGAGNDTLDGGDRQSESGFDIADYSATANSVTVDLATGHALAGVDGNDVLANIGGVRGSAFADTLTGSAGDNLFNAGLGDDSIAGGDGRDTVSYQGASGGVTVSLATGAATGAAGTDTLRSIENVRGSAFSDTLIGSTGDNVFYGDLGDDAIEGGGGLDTVTYEGASGGVTINLATGAVAGAAGSDTLSSIESVVGTVFDDNITGGTLAAGQIEFLHGGGGGNDTITGGATGQTVVSFDGINAAVVMNVDGVSGFVLAGFSGSNSAPGILADLSAAGTTIKFELFEGSGSSFITFSGIEGVVGNTGSDSLVGNGGDNYFEGGQGWDTIIGGGGNDIASYRDATNPVVVNLGSGQQTVPYFDADGQSHGTQTINAGQVLQNNGGNDNFNSEFDSLSGIERIEGGAYNDSMFGATGASDYFDGGAGNDVLRGGGGTGSDTFVGGAGFDQVNFGGTTPGTTGVDVNLQAGTAVRGGLGTDSLSGIEQIFGTAFNDTMVGAQQTYTGRFHDFVIQFYSGGGGNDVFTADASDGQYDVASYQNNTTATSVIANLGTGTATGATTGTDALINIDELIGGTLADSLTGGSASKNIAGLLFESFRGNAGSDTINGLGGEDRVDYRFSTGAIYVNLGNTVIGTGADSLASGSARDGEGGIDKLTEIENVRGSAFSDRIFGGGTQNASTLYDFEVFEGMEGNDTIDGLGGFDVASYFSSDAGVTVNLAGGFANDGFGTRDTLINIEQVTGSDYDDLLIGSDTTVDREAFRGGAGNDTIDGGAGNDAAFYNASPNAVVVNLVTGIAQDGYGDIDTLASIEAVRGSIFDDSLLGGAGNESFEGIQGNDTIDGGAGNDRADYHRDGAAVTVDLGADSASGALSGTDLLIDIEAVRGTGFNDLLLGGAGNDTLEGDGGNDSLDGLGGSDVVSYRNALAGVNVNLALSTVSGTAGNDTIAGFEGVRGSDFNDTLASGAGDDTLIGGLGNDAYSVNSLADVVVEADSEGTDTVTSTVSFALGGNLENLILAGTDNIAGDGDAGNNAITGNSGNNTLDGGAGSDTLTGGAGNDTYVIDRGSDVITEGLNGGTDTVILASGFNPAAFDAPISFSLKNNLENVTVGGPNTVANVTANAAANFLIGGSFNDTLDGGGGNDTLDGGQGLDKMIGGAGNDTYFLRNVGDVAEEGASGGTDLVFTSLAITSLGLNIENLTLQNDISITIGRGNALANLIKGNSFDNSLFGNDGNDTLEGGGGNDRLYGGAGSDSYVVDGGDVVIEVSGSKSDQALVKQSVDLRTSVGIEGATAQAALYDIDIIGNKQANKVSGNETANRLEGGKAGKVATNDTLDGGLGSDTYVISSALDKIIDTGGTGDGIETDFNMSLVPFATIENLYQIGTGNIVGVGNALANLMRGNTGNNLLTGMDGADDIEGNAGNDTLDGGKGNDRLYGGEGNDTYVLDSAADLFFESARFETVSVTASSDLQPGTVISGDGRYIQFYSAAALVAADTNGTGDAYVKDMLTGTLTRASSGTADVTHSSLNPGGRFVAFTTTSSLVAADGNVHSDVYLRDLTPPTATTPATVLLSRATTGQAGNGASEMSDISSDGRFVAISSLASNLVVDDVATTEVNEADTNGLRDIFIIDRLANTLVRVSVADDEAQANAAASGGVAISANGRLVAFGSTATNLVDGGTSAVGHIFVRDLGAQTTELVSVDTNEVQADAAGSNARISNDGRYVVFESAATNLVASDTNGVSDIFMRDLALDTTVRVSQSAADAQGNGASSIAGISADGRYVVFQSNASNLVAGDTNGVSDVFVKDLQTPAIARVSNAGAALAPDISEDGRYIVFTSGTDVVRIANPLIMGQGGIDTVVAPFSHTLGDEFENLTLSGTAAINGTGNALDNVLTGNSGANVLNGGAGDDTYVVGAGDTIIDSGGTDTVIASVNTTLGVGLEHLTLSGTTPLSGTGNAAPNLIKGNTAANTLNGMGGVDTLEGGAGNDTYIADASDTITELANAGTDTVQISGSIDLTVVLNVENVLLLPGGDFNAVGNDGANLLTGNTGANVLNGGLGNDTMVGLAGDDTYHVNAAGDVVTEAGTGTGDMVISGISYALGATLEHLTLTGNDGLNGTGNASNNSMTGNAGNNVLDGKAGVDSMAGGDGNDTYFVDNSSDQVDESSSNGFDVVLASASFVLGAGVEKLTLTGTAVGATGNALDNLLTGNAAANSLAGGDGDDTLDGGGGNDSMAGGSGNDLYLVNAAGDAITDSAGTNDSVISSASYTLSLLGGVENLTLIGTAANGTGNDFNNYLKGNAAANSLSGGAGNDTLDGGAGNDIYLVDSADDLVIEAAGGGIDTVRVSGLLDLQLWVNVENLTLTASGSGTGNALNNLISGFTGDDTLDGGAGNDTLVGGAGGDTYVVDSAGDVITDTVVGGAADTVIASINYTLGATLENLTLAPGAGDIKATGNAGTNILTGNEGDNYLAGLAGNDSLVGNGGVDVADFFGTTAVVTVNLGAGTATGAGIGNDSIGSDIEGVRGGTGNDSFTGSGALNEFVDYSAATGAVTASLAGTASGAGVGSDSFTGFEGIRGSKFNDTLTGDASDNFFYANAGDSIIGDAGIDTVFASTTFTLLNADLENLALIGTADIDATGNAGGNEITGNAGNNYLSGGAGNDTLAGGDGLDIADYSDGGSVTVDLVAGTATGASGNDVIGNDVEGVRGSSSADSLTGGAGDLVDYSGFGGPVLVDLTADGGGGNDTIVGFGGIRGSDLGNDTLTGDGGDNFFYVTAGDVVAGGGGNDTIYSAVSFTLPADVGTIILTGASGATAIGNESANQITGNAGNNSLAGLGGNDTLDGGVGNDTLAGGDGADLYLVDAAGDRVVEAGGDLAVDEVDSKVSFDASGIGLLERIVLLGTAALNAIGNALDNYLGGNAGDNTLDGRAGADTMVGGAGNDTYIVDNSSDVADESTGSGFDLVRASASFTLGADVENLTLSGAGNINGTGNGGDNLITGNAGSNALDGGAGNDTLVGGLGNDTYTVDSAGDAVTELATAGTDTLRTPFNTTLAATLENLAYTGAGDWIGTGNAAANSITGGAGHDTLSGGGGNDGNDTLDGGIGNDLLIGGNGNDTYVVDSPDDVIVEAAGIPAGIDSVQAKINWTLGLNLENLAAYAGTGDWSGSGNAVNNVIAGAGGNDSLFGDGGADTLNGGLGNDTLDGGTGIDSMAGGAGDDVYVIDVATDKFSEALNAGTDTLVTPFDTVMVANFENLTLSGTGNAKATGNDLANVLEGNEGNNLLTALGGQDSLAGAGGNDTLDGGAGNDTMAGGAGDDRFVFDSLTDSALEAPGAGSDTVVAPFNYTLGLGSNLDNLLLTGTGNFSGTGNELANRITGNTGNNNLTGGDGNDTLDGGAGSDFLIGGNGDDSFIWDANDTAAGAVVGGAGNDSLVFTGAGQTLNLTLAGVSERFQDIERVDIGGTAGINTFIFDFDDIRDLSDESQVVRIDGDLFDVVRSEHNTGSEHWELLGVVPDGEVFYIEYMYTYPNATSITIQVNQDLDQFIS